MLNYLTVCLPETETEEKARREAEEEAQQEAGQQGLTEAGTDQLVPKNEGSGQESEPGGTASGPNDSENAENIPRMESNKQLHNGMETAFKSNKD